MTDLGKMAFAFVAWHTPIVKPLPRAVRQDSAETGPRDSASNRPSEQFLTGSENDTGGEAGRVLPLGLQGLVPPALLRALSPGKRGWHWISSAAPILNDGYELRLCRRHSLTHAGGYAMLRAWAIVRPRAALRRQALRRTFRQRFCRDREDEKSGIYREIAGPAVPFVVPGCLPNVPGNVFFFVARRFTVWPASGVCRASDGSVVSRLNRR